MKMLIPGLTPPPVLLSIIIWKGSCGRKEVLDLFIDLRNILLLQRGPVMGVSFVPSFLQLFSCFFLFWHRAEEMKISVKMVSAGRGPSGYVLYLNMRIFRQQQAQNGANAE